MGDFGPPYFMKFCKQGHELTETNSYYNSEGFRSCRKCHYARSHKSRRERMNWLRFFNLLGRSNERERNEGSGDKFDHIQ
jgi:hypothetical protein